MMFEEKTFLKKYLNDNYSQNLFDSNESVSNFLKEYESIFYEILPSKINDEKILNDNFITKKIPFKEKLKDFLELNTLKELLLTSSVFYKKKHNVDYKYFDEIILKMNKEIKKWDGNFYFVYLPSWTRYNNKYSVANYFQKSKIKKIVENKNIVFLDIDKYFKSKNVDNLDIFIFGIYGHYTKRGYELIAENFINIVSSKP